MSAKNARARHRRFLTAGFFPPELPKCFYSEKLGKYRNYLLANFDKLPKLGKSKDPNYYYYKGNRSSFNYPRFTKHHRRHSFINPISYFFLSKILSDKYVELRKISKNSKISVSPSVFDWSGDRALKRPVFESREFFLSNLNARFAYILHTDLSSFYHSIYTHAIAWAIHGKNFAKKNRSLKHAGNLIDLISRNSQDGQTIGLPVGPDTSRMIAELVGSAIDLPIQSSPGITLNSAMRFVDDFSIGTHTKERAEAVIASIRRSANTFELDINNEKTFISASSSYYVWGWKSYIRSIIPKPPYDPQSIDLFLYNLNRTSGENRDSNVAKFALQNARRAFLECDSWKQVEMYLISIYRENPTIISILVEIFIIRHLTKADLTIDLIQDLVQSSLPVLCEQQKAGEAIWLLHLAISLGIPLKTKVLKPFLAEEDPLIAVLIADARSKGLVEGNISFSHWNTFLTADGLNSHMWLYAYETTLKGINGTTKIKHVTDHEYFRYLYKKKIEFYRSSQDFYKLAPLLKKMKNENLAKSKLVDDFELDLSFDIEEIDFDDGAADEY
ncbi:RNA-directed DNA polymerase [Mesorhizobium sp.]|uniref:RNA-directed DNA polymerase n=1 Tax=Mesorhizobium sp. TaxID=1871066 RepID=UPI0011FB031E|nr:RNA-directed DNA polymerase [Mesorhizobium sp.]TIL63407.1 MAG: RNA-directed DNA polymerase [Mesorhizobium sp.]